MFCLCKRTLYTVSRNSNNPSIKKYYKDKCKTLANVTQKAKRLHYDKQVSNAQDKIKKTW